MDTLDILFVIVIVENKTNNKDPTLVVIIIIIEAETMIKIGTEMVTPLTTIPITETVLTVILILALGVNLGIIIIEAEMMIIIETLLIGHLLLIIEV